MSIKLQASTEKPESMHLAVRSVVNVLKITAMHSLTVVNVSTIH